MAKGPLAVRWGEWTLDDPHAGAVGSARVELENAGTVAVARRDPPRLPLARRPRQPDRVGRRAHRRCPRSLPASGRRWTPACAPRSRPAATASRSTWSPSHRAWFSELGSETSAIDVDVLPRGGEPRAEWPGWVEPTADGARAHRRGARRGLRGRRRRDRVGRRSRPPRPRSLAPYEPGPGRIPNFASRAALPVGARRARAGAARGRRGPARVRRPGRRPWLYDGRIVLEAHPKRRAAGP